jgi:hypothetical protein
MQMCLGVLLGFLCSLLEEQQQQPGSHLLQLDTRRRLAHQLLPAIPRLAPSLQLFSQIENPLPTGYVQLWALCSTARGGVCLLASLAVSAGPTVVSMAKLPDWYAAASTGLRCLPLLAGLQTRLDPHLVGLPPTQQLPAAALAHSLVQLSSDIVAGSRAVLEPSMHSSAPPSAVLDEEGQMATWQLHSATCRLVHWASSSSGYTTLQRFSAAAPARAELQVTMLTAACLLLLSVCRLWHQRAAHDQPDSGAAGGSGSQAEVDKRLRYTAVAAAHPTAGVLALAALMVLAARWRCASEPQAEYNFERICILPCMPCCRRSVQSMCLATFEAMDALVGAVGTQKLTLDTCNDLGSALQTAALHGPAALARSPVLRSLLSQLMLRMVQVSAGSMPAGLPFSSQEGAGRQAAASWR